MIALRAIVYGGYNRGRDNSEYKSKFDPFIGLNLVDVASSILFDIGYLSDSFWPTSKYYTQGISLKYLLFTVSLNNYFPVQYMSYIPFINDIYLKI